MAIDFDKFTGKVMDAVKGRLNATDMGVLSRLFRRTKKRNVVLAAGLLSALKVGGASKRDTAELAAILERANSRILEGKEPFTKADESALERIFRGANVPRGAEEKLKHNVKVDQDELLASEIVNSITISSAEKLRGFVPAKKIPAVKFEEEERKRARR